MSRWLKHPLFAPVLVLVALGWGTGIIVFLLVGPGLGTWARAVLTYCFGWSAATRAYRLDAVLLATLQAPLFALVVGLFYADELRGFARRIGGRVVGGAALLGFVAAAATLVLSGDVVGSAPATAAGAPVRDGRPAPRAALTDHRDRPFDLGAPTDRPLAVTFVYTNCHGTCPALVATLRATAALVGDRALFVAVTLDPARDTPPALAAYAGRWDLGDSWRLLTGPPAVVDATRRAWGVAAERLPGGEIAHANVIVLVDRAGRIAYTYPGVAQAPRELAAALGRLAEERG